ncbi:MAG TPA: histidine kinase [Chitinophagaceae bacterium]|nr:histidine kinase [Chitinophagaceae bacterium]
MGGTERGFAVYYPEKDKVTTWLIAKKETNFGFWSSCTDDSGTVWLGTAQRGLMYYNDYQRDNVDVKKIFRIDHPLLEDGVKVMQLKIWGKWLIIGIGKNVLIMDLKEWYQKKKVSIRYINPQEGNFSSPLQENSILIDSRDSTIWFATGDMLYQWDIKKWLSLPVYDVRPNITWHSQKGDYAVADQQPLTINPIDNTLKFSIWFQSRDNMPRYMSVALAKKGDSIRFPPPSLQTAFEYSNLAPGRYELAIQICQSNGSVSVFRYPILVKKFWWQYWWVWVVFLLLLMVPILLWVSSRNKAKLLEERARRREAEQQKMLSALQIVSLGNQFRPHFILNALNTVGAELDNKPQAESVLSRLGESIDLIFSHSQQQKISHPLSDEWRLVKNIIDIHRMMYLKNLETDIPEQTEIDRLSNILIPLGLLQIPVENALLHGLTNREIGPWKLDIDLAETEKDLIINITDNGVGRAKATLLSNYRKHGTGTKNLKSILEIVNAGKAEKITFTYVDEIFFSENDYKGTKVIITIPKKFQYEI